MACRPEAIAIAEYIVARLGYEPRKRFKIGTAAALAPTLLSTIAMDGAGEHGLDLPSLT